MPLVRVKHKYQVTIPSSIRDRVALEVGDMLEATLIEEGILLKPQVVVDRKSAAISNLRKAFSELNEKISYVDMTDDEIMDQAIKLVKETRADWNSERVFRKP